MRNSIIILLFGIFSSLTSCRTDFETIPSNGSLEFSEKTIYLDTIFANIGSSTYQLKVYNRSNNDIRIPKIELGKGQSSKYRITVDGMTGNNNRSFENVELLANDSLFIFIETTVNIAETESDFTYNDKILFDVGTNQQSVDLVTLIQDAIFIKPNRDLDAKIYETINIENFDPETRGHTLRDDELNWNNAKPYVIYGNVLVPNGKTLTIGEGTSVHFHKDATLIVDNGAKLIIDGKLNLTDSEGVILTKREVTFEGDRLEPFYEDVPGQWGAIFIFSGTKSLIVNEINHLTLKNATVGLFLASNTNNNSPNVKIDNSQFYNCSNIGILTRASIINGTNTVINNCGIASLACTYGGNNNFNHCTFNNNWNSTKQVAVLLTDYFEDIEAIYANNTINIFNFTNCIVYGTNQRELAIEKKGNNDLIYNFKNCLLKYSSSQIANPNFYNFTNPLFYQDCKIATNSTQFNPQYSNDDTNKLWPTIDLDPIIPPFLPTTPLDILGRSRTNIGAYQFIAE
ncbi:hypothetical protein [Flavobacterium sp.]|jgi:hypothetical protein|uniref:hypothetical protein n=1 Tax=Flavobacterium sp. TaxID=239 RepID=UPI0037BF55CA